jgi:N-acetyl-D-muramate 6-phosphate phosphatase
MKAWLFDLDGTLVDTAPDLAAAANQLRERRGLGPLPLAHYRPWASAGARGLIHAALGLAPEHPDFAALRADFLAHYRAHLADQAALFPGLDAVLRQFEAEGRPWGVVTNKPAWLTLPLMAALGLDRRAAVCVSADEAAAPKPAPDALFLACERSGLAAADCGYVGDDRRDIVAGRAAGMTTVAVRWGYFGEGGPIESWGADHVIDRPADLLPLAAPRPG